MAKSYRLATWSKVAARSTSGPGPGLLSTEPRGAMTKLREREPPTRRDVLQAAVGLPLAGAMSQALGPAFASAGESPTMPETQASPKSSPRADLKKVVRSEERRVG